MAILFNVQVSSQRPQAGTTPLVAVPAQRVFTKDSVLTDQGEQQVTRFLFPLGADVQQNDLFTVVAQGSRNAMTAVPDARQVTYRVHDWDDVTGFLTQTQAITYKLSQ